MKTRREFLQLSALGLGSLTLPSYLFSQEEESNYKALVVIYQAGGNDGLNMFIPSSNDPKCGYPNYAKIRDTLSVKNQELTLTEESGELDLTNGNPYASNNSLEESYTKGFYPHSNLDVATNALMPEVAQLVNQNKIAILLNTGNLIEPVTKSELLNKSKPLPPFLFAHNHQTKLMMNGEASKLDYTGWAGRLFDNWQGINSGDIYGLNIGIGSTEHLFYGQKSTPLIINQNGPTSYKRLNRDIYNELLEEGDDNIFYNLYNRIKKHSFDMQDIIVNDWRDAPTWSSHNAYGKDLFSMPSDSELNQKSPTSADKSMLKKLEAVAKLSYIGKRRGLKRQIFYVFDGGYDTHSNQTQQHARKLRGLSLGIGDFQRALKEKGMENEVTTFTVSDFGRSIGNNGDGTDHAWGGTYFVMGGAVQGGCYGEMPDLTLGSNNDISHKGRLIPTTSMSQYYGTLLKWFGVDTSTMKKVLPELQNFQEQDLGFMG
jgi:uncharacterized protein (DUF1501 family)